MIGRRLAQYRILEKLGERSMGVVYRARDERLERDVAIKVLPEDAALTQAVSAFSPGPGSGPASPGLL